MIRVSIFSSLPIIAYHIIFSWRGNNRRHWTVVAGLVLTLIFAVFGGSGNSIIVFGLFVTYPTSFLIYIAFWLKSSKKETEINASRLIQVSKEKEELILAQNELLEKEVRERTSELSQSLENLKATQSQLIQSEKMASLGELTAGIAHEIQNPLNFVNNFSEINEELIEEAGQELDQGNIADVKSILEDIRENEKKINSHGKRADTIVKSMLQHSSKNSGQKELTNLNALCDEYLRLAFHGFRAKDKSFNAGFKTDLDPDLPELKVIPQDMGRVLLNLINNAFQAVSERAKLKEDEYEPLVSISTRNAGYAVLIKITDNGPGIPPQIKDKIFQPFFTTKPTGQGTGLGLSLSYDIVKAHGGELKLQSTLHEGTTMIVTLPL